MPDGTTTTKTYTGSIVVNPRSDVIIAMQEHQKKRDALLEKVYEASGVIGGFLLAGDVFPPPEEAV